MINMQKNILYDLKRKLNSLKSFCLKNMNINMKNMR